jgi:hypothetical protein
MHNDGHRYSVGLGASTPIAWDDRVEANLEIWVTERGYPATTTAAGTATDGVTFQAASLAYGLRVHGAAAVRPYGLVALGFQGSRLRATTLATPTAEIKEETLEPMLHVGLGLEWRVGRDLFSLDWRRGYVQGDFTGFGGRDLDLGGEFLGIGLGHHW